MTCQTERSFDTPFMDKLSRNPVQLAHNEDDLWRIQERAIRQPDRTGVLRHASSNEWRKSIRTLHVDGWPRAQPARSLRTCGILSHGRGGVGRQRQLVQHRWSGLKMTLLLLFAILFLLPLAVAAILHFTNDRIVDWRNADRSSAGLLPPALPQTPAVVRIFSARTVRWRGIVATHSWIVIKDTGAPATADLTTQRGASRSGWIGSSRMVAGLGVSRRWFLRPTERKPNA